MGDFETLALVEVESPVQYHSCTFLSLTGSCDTELGPCLAGSLTGAVASQIVTEAFKGALSPEGNRASKHKSICALNCKTYKSSRHESGI